MTPTAGGVESYCTPKSDEVLLPAMSVQVPWTRAFAPSGPAYVGDEHEATPEVASVPCQSKRTEWLYQPFASGVRATDGVVRAGGVTSYLTTSESDELLPALSVQVTLLLAPLVSGPP